MRKITVIGTGYVGLVSGGGISDFGHYVTCVDIVESKIKCLQEGEIRIYEPGLKNLIERNVSAGRLSFTTNVDGAIQDADVILLLWVHLRVIMVKQIYLLWKRLQDPLAKT